MSKTESKSLIDFLLKIPYFSELSKVSLKQLAAEVIEESYRKNETIFLKDDVGNGMYLILEGKVKIHDGNHIFNELKENDCFGEYALIDNEKRSASATTTERSILLKIQHKNFIDLISNNKGVAQGILSATIKRHRELDTILEELASSKNELQLASSKIFGLVNGAMDAIIMFDSRFQIVLTNPSAEKLFENNDVLQRNLLFFLDETSASLIESLVKSGLEGNTKTINNYLPDIIKVIGSNETETLNEGTISKFGNDENSFYTLILRNIEERLIAEDKINLLTKQTLYLEEQIQELTNDYGIIAEDNSMKQVLNLIQHVSITDATVLITGETGTGKELVARAIHKASNRKENPLIRINCGAIPANLIESELFGHKKGAFTGATEDRKGRFLLADKGTIFLDEIGELPIELQPKLLRVIQEGEFDPVGSSETVKVTVRIIAATHRDLLDLSQQGKFREDLYYRLNVFPIHVPALHERGNDIFLIADVMMQQFSKKLNKPVNKLSETDKDLLKAYNWPGNVRELQNLIERAVIVSNNGKLNWLNIIPSNTKTQQTSDTGISEKILTSKELLAFEKENILKALKRTRWKISGNNGAAALLNLPATTLASRIKALGIERPI